ncbi:MAG: YjfB family protein [Treponema sp.]|nr:YjfB family protein [Treponema sp.]
MDTQSTMVNMPQARVQEQAGFQVQAMSLKMAKEQGAALEKMLASAQFFADPKMGQNINILA